MDAGGGSQHRVYEKLVRPAGHQASPFEEYPAVHRQYLVGIRNLVQPSFDLTGFGRILASS
jgi:hypothetical protein